MPGRVSILAGSGALVPHAVSAAQAVGNTVQVLAFTPRPDLGAVKMVKADLGNPLGIIWSLKIFRTTHIVMAGAIELSDKTREGLIRFANGAASRSGDAAPVGDAALAAIGKILRQMTGAELVGVHELAPELLASEGTMAGTPLAPDRLAGAQFALQTARAIGLLDIGQAAITSGRRVIAVEDIAGTDALIARAGVLAAAGLAGDGSHPLILAKAMKPQQPRFADLPAIGPETVVNCAKAGISSIVVEAGKSLVIDRIDVLARAVSLGVSIHGLGPGDG